VCWCKIIVGPILFLKKKKKHRCFFRQRRKKKEGFRSIGLGLGEWA